MGTMWYSSHGVTFFLTLFYPLDNAVMRIHYRAPKLKLSVPVMIYLDVKQYEKCLYNDMWGHIISGSGQNNSVYGSKNGRNFQNHLHNTKNTPMWWRYNVLGLCSLYRKNLQDILFYFCYGSHTFSWV